MSTRFVSGGWLVFALIGGGAAIACSGSSSGNGGGGHVCTPGASIACTGPAGCAGGQVCKADGTGYDACNCGGGDGGGGGDAGQQESGGGVAYKGYVGMNKGGGSYYASANFYVIPDGGISDACPGPQAGGCCYTPNGGGDAGSVSITFVGAGVITVEDMGNALAMMSPDAQHHYGTDNTMSAMLQWNAKDPVSVSAAGDVVHAFTAQSTAPDDIANVTPNFMQAVHIPKSMAFAVTWTPGSQAGATMNLEVDDNTSGDYIDCTVMDSAGTATVPSSLLSMFSGANGLVSLSRVSPAAMASSDNATVSFSVSTLVQGQTIFQ